jgi:invasion protein IalB
MFADEGYIRDTIMERGLAMRGLRIPMRQTLAVLMTGLLVCGSSGFAQSQTASKSTSAAKSKAPAAKQSAAPAALGGAEPSRVGQFGTWGAYTATPNGKKVCFALAKPASSKTNPANRPRDAAYAFISTRPAEKVANEVSIMIGYQLKPGSEGTVEIGGARFAMYSQGDGLWIKNAAEEDRMVEALRKGADATVKGVSVKGTETIDVFPLKGLAQALDKLAQECRR